MYEMPQEIPAWRDYERTFRIIRTSTLGKKNDKFESKSQLDELFQGSDGADKRGKGTLSLGEVNKGLILELKDRTKLKHSDELVVESVEEAIRRGFHVTKNLGAAGRKDELERDELRMLLIYLERFFHLLDMFKVVELEPDRPATVKSGGAERPLRLLQKDFARTIPKLKEWHLSIGQPAIFFKVSARLSERRETPRHPSTVLQCPPLPDIPPQCSSAHLYLTSLHSAPVPTST